LFAFLSVLAVLAAFSSTAFAQEDPNAANNANGNGRQRRGQNGGGNFDPAQMQQQMMDRMREQFGVTDDAEWKIITDRVTAVTELRRAAGGGMGGAMAAFRGGQNNNNQQGGGRRGNFAASPEQDALRQAITDKLPDAEVKARLDRFREVRKANEEKLAKAQEDLRAVLNVRQEAVAVMFGLLP
jgi:hypothetical protein